MGRASLGLAAKTRTGSVRVTEGQHQWFADTYGSLGRFLQLKVNEELATVSAADQERGTP